MLIGNKVVVQKWTCPRPRQVFATNMCISRVRLNQLFFYIIKREGRTMNQRAEYKEVTQEQEDKIELIRISFSKIV